MDNITENNFFDGSVKVFQSKNGYRFSIDPILLAYHINAPDNSKILDIGTGSGIIPLSLTYRNRNIKVYGVEIQDSLYRIAEKNVAANRLENKITIIQKDIMDISQKDIKGQADIVVTNPPYRKPGSGRINPLSEKAVARHEISLDLEKLLKKTRGLLKNRGKFFIIYPASRSSELLYKMEKNRITPKKIRFIHSFKNTDAVMVICEGLLNGNSGVKVLPPLVIYQSEDVYTEEVSKMMK